MTAIPGSGPVLLGIFDHGISPEDDKKSTGYASVKIGGVANLLPNTNIKEVQEKLRCTLCNKEMALHAQIYVPLEADEDAGWCWHRVLYVYGCPLSTCQGTPESFRVLRGIYVSEELLEEREKECALLTEQLNKGTVDFNSQWDDGDWNKTEKTFDMAQLSDLLSEEAKKMPACKLKDSIAENNHSRGAVPLLGGNEAVVFPAYALYDTFEKQKARKRSDTEFAHEYELLREYNEHSDFSGNDDYDDDNTDDDEKCSQEGDDDSMDAEDGNFARSPQTDLDIAAKQEGDQIFQLFYERVILYPKQLVRYCLNGEPLPCSRYCYKKSGERIEICRESEVAALMEDSGKNSVESSSPLISISQRLHVPMCPLCHSPRRFEMQLMPGMIHYLLANNDKFDMDWGTVLIYTCQRNCAFNSHQLNIPTLQNLSGEIRLAALRRMIEVAKSLRGRAVYYDEICVVQPGV